METIELTDGEAVIQALTSGKPVDPEVAKRIREKARAITERLRKENGEMDVVLPILREIRE